MATTTTTPFIIELCRAESASLLRLTHRALLVLAFFACAALLRASFPPCDAVPLCAVQSVAHSPIVNASAPAPCQCLAFCHLVLDCAGAARILDRWAFVQNEPCGCENVSLGECNASARLLAVADAKPPNLTWRPTAAWPRCTSSAAQA